MQKRLMYVLFLLLMLVYQSVNAQKILPFNEGDIIVRVEFGTNKIIKPDLQSSNILPTDSFDQFKKIKVWCKINNELVPINNFEYQLMISSGDILSFEGKNEDVSLCGLHKNKGRFRTDFTLTITITKITHPFKGVINNPIVHVANLDNQLLRFPSKLYTKEENELYLKKYGIPFYKYQEQDSILKVEAGLPNSKKTILILDPKKGTVRYQNLSTEFFTFFSH